MKIKARRVKEGFVIPLLEGYKDENEIELEISVIRPERMRLSPEFIKNNWKDLIMTSIDNSDYFKSQAYILERALGYEENI